mgnify:CR=1 FL=1
MEEVFFVVALLIALPWIVLHYVTKWKTSASITSDDEVLLARHRAEGSDDLAALSD